LADDERIEEHVWD